MDGSHSRLIIVGNNKSNSFEQEKSSLAKSKEGYFYIFLLDLYKITVLESTVIFLSII